MLQWFIFVMYLFNQIYVTVYRVHARVNAPLQSFVFFFQYML